jgi:hypothetical protein
LLVSKGKYLSKDDMKTTPVDLSPQCILVKSTSTIFFLILLNLSGNKAACLNMVHICHCTMSRSDILAMEVFWAVLRLTFFSALYVIDLKRFRKLAAGDRLRGQYQVKANKQILKCVFSLLVLDTKVCSCVHDCLHKEFVFL